MKRKYTKIFVVVNEDLRSLHAAPVFKKFVTKRGRFHTLCVSLPAANFHDLYQRYSRDVYRFALYLSGDSARAEDLTSESFLRLWTAPAPARVDTVKQYLFTIVRHLYIQNWRLESRHAPLTDAPANIETIEDSLDTKAELYRVLAALADLEPLERAAILLRSEQQMAYEEIARLLEISTASARVKVHRARQKLMHVRKGTTTP
jgi:RNA polymerase sigma-70 factor (ECF subfamily)